MAPSIVAIREEMIDVYLWHNTRKVADVDALCANGLEKKACC